MATTEPARPPRARRSAAGAGHRAATPDTTAVAPSALAGGAPAGVLGLQTTAGNRAVGVLLGAGPAVQRALASPRFVGDPVLADVDAGNTTLKRGDNGAPVRKVQHAIHDAGIRFRIFGVDGAFEAETRLRVGTYKSREGVGGDP